MSQKLASNGRYVMHLWPLLSVWEERSRIRSVTISSRLRMDLKRNLQVQSRFPFTTPLYTSPSRISLR